MSNISLSPDAILEQTNLTGAVADIQDSPASPDANWLTAPGNNVATTVRTSLPTPPNNLNAGAALQQFRLWVRKTNHSTDPLMTVELYEDGALIATLATGAGVSSISGQLLTYTWDAALLSAISGVDVECRISGTSGGGKPTNRAALEIGAMAWDADYAVSTGPTLLLALVPA
ncbi:MAG: hypothetical protein JKY34_12555 [Kordiimonadaceae bacterium]|nr:hypothetical protein [Kordiimonadaceae bacterium]PCJ37776.1 MAG: hypothetical protein COA75_03375 [Cellvibrionales bacterium]